MSAENATDPLDILRERMGAARAYSVFGLDGKWHVDEEEWVTLIQAVEDALPALERERQAADTLAEATEDALNSLHTGPLRDGYAYQRLDAALARYRDSQPATTETT